MTEVREIVDPYLDALADVSVRDPQRKALFDEMSLELKEHDYPTEASDAEDNEHGDAESDDESRRDTEAEERAAWKDVKRQMGVDEDGDAYRGR